MVSEDLAGSEAEEDVAASLSSGERSPLGAARRRIMMMQKTMTKPVSMSFRRPQRSCVLTEEPHCIFLTANSSSGRLRFLRQTPL